MRTFTREKLEEAAKRRHILPRAAAYTLLAVLCVIYALLPKPAATEESSAQTNHSTGKEQRRASPPVKRFFPRRVLAKVFFTTLPQQPKFWKGTMQKWFQRPG